MHGHRILLTMMLFMLVYPDHYFVIQAGRIEWGLQSVWVCMTLIIPPRLPLFFVRGLWDHTKPENPKLANLYSPHLRTTKRYAKPQALKPTSSGAGCHTALRAGSADIVPLDSELRSIGYCDL